MTESFTTLEPRNGQSPSGELALRIRGGDYHGRVVRIRAAQCTIGSAPDCTLRLTTPGVRPLHCIILRGDAGATVRRWSPDTQLNGRAFSDALLVSGDRLEVGPIELEVLDETDRSPLRRSSEPAVGQLPVTQLAGEIVQHIRRGLKRNKQGRKQRIQQKRLVKSNRRVKQLEAELEQVQTLLSAAQQTFEPTPTASVGTQPLEQQQTAKEEEAERRVLLKSLEEKEHLKNKLEAAFAEIQLLQQSQQSVIAPSNSDDSQKREAAWEAERRELLKSLEEKDHLEHRLELALNELSNGIGNEHLAAGAQQQQEQLAEERRQLRAKAADLEQLQAWCNEVERRAQEDEAAAQAKALVLETRITELEAQLAAVNVGRTAPRSDYPASADFQSTGLNDDRCQRDELLTAARSSVEELRRAGELSSQEWGQREQELSQRIECLEKLARNLEDELRAATSQPDKGEVAEEQRLALEHQLTAVQRQWSEQRQQLEEQALSAHQQLQDAEGQILSLRDALLSAQTQVRERDQLLSQLRDEVRAQLAAWQNEREQLLAKVDLEEQRHGAGIDESGEGQQDIHVNRESDPVWSISRHLDSSADQAEREYCGSDGESGDDSEDASAADDEGNVAAFADDGAGDVLARLGAAGIWRNHDVVEEGGTPFHVRKREVPFATPQPSSEIVDNGISSGSSWQDIEMTDNEPSTSAEATLEVRTFPASGVEANELPKSSRPDEEESIEAYMNRLMKRVRGDAVAQAYTIQESPSQAAPAEAVPQPAVDPVENTNIQTAAPSQEFLPRKSAPEQASDLAAMRELAVHSARQAISQSTQQRFQKSSLGTTLGACALVGLSVGLFGWGFDTGNMLAWIGGGVTLVAGLYLAARRLRMRKRAKH